VDLQTVVESRLFRPQGFVEAANRRRPRGVTLPLVLVAADGPSRGLLVSSDNPLAAADREDYLTRLFTALDQTGVDGVIGTPVVLDELLLLSALEGKIVFGSMNYGGIVGSKFELDDVFTGFDAESLAAVRYNGALIRLRLNLDDPVSARVVERSARAVDDLANHRLLTLLEPSFAKVVDGRVVDDFSADALIRAIAVSTSLGRTSRNMWLSLPVVSGLDRVVRSTTVPTLVRADSVTGSIDTVAETLARAVGVPGVYGVILGTSALFPPDGDVEAAVNSIVDAVRRSAEAAAEADRDGRATQG
jgi:hypothetical protein